MEPFGGLVQVLDPEGDLVEDGIADGVVIEVRALLHGLVEAPEQLAEVFIPLPGGEPAHGEVDLLGQNHIAGLGLVGNRSFDLLGIAALELGHALFIVSQIGGVVLELLLVGGNGSSLLLLQGLDLAVQGVDLRLGLLDLGLFLGGVQGLLDVEELGALVGELGDLAVELFLLLLAEGAAVLALQLQGLHGPEGLRTVFQLGILMELFLGAVDHVLGRIGQRHHGIGQLLVVEDDGALADIAVGVEHTGKGLGEHRLAGAGLADDGHGLVLMEVQGDTADGGQGPAADAEIDVQVLDGQ